MNISTSNLVLPKNILWGAATISLQMAWMLLFSGPEFPTFESMLMLTTVAFFTHEKGLTRWLDASVLSVRNALLVLTITVLIACLAGAEKIFASWLIWGLAVIMQALILQYAADIFQKKLSLNAKHILLVMATQAMVLFLMMGDTNYYMSPRMTYGTVSTVQHIRLGSPLWLLVYFFVPAFLVQLFAERTLPGSRDFWARLQREGDAPFRRALYVGCTVLFAIMALLTVEMLRPHMGQGITLGDESGYVIYARALATFKWKEFVFGQPPLYMGVLGFLTMLFGDQTQIGLYLNCAMLVATFALLLYAAQALTGNFFFSFLAALFFVANRGTYIYVWTALTEPMNACLAVAVMAGALYAIQKRTFASYMWFAAACLADVMLRAQNTLFVFLLIGLVYWYIAAHTRTKLSRNDILGFLAFFFLPQLAWCLYRIHFANSFDITDGRGVYMVFGYNAPNMIHGLDGTWTDQLNAWMKDHPGWRKSEMVWAAVKMRLDNPMETLSFWYWRTVELFNFRFMDKFGVIPVLKSNAQLLVLYGLFALTLFWRRSSTHLVTLFLLAAFYISFILIFSEFRYRYPGDAIMYLGVVRLLHEIFAKQPMRLTAPVDASYLKIFADKRIYAPTLAALFIMALPNITGLAHNIPGTVPTRAVLPRDEQLTITGVTATPLNTLRNQSTARLSAKIVTVPLVFEGFRFRVGYLSDAIAAGIPDGEFNYADLHGLELPLKEPSATPHEINVKKFALETTSLYVGPKLIIGKPYNAKVLLLKKPAVLGPHGWTLIGRLLEASPASE